MQIFIDSLRVIGDEKPISGEKLSESLSIDIITPMLMNNNTDVVQEENVLAREISQHGKSSILSI